MTLAFLGTDDSKLDAAIIAAGVALATSVITVLSSGPLRLWVERKLQQKQTSTQHELQRAETESRAALQRAEAEASYELQRVQARVEYEFAQRKELRAQVGKFRGRLLEGATSLNFRLDNLRENRAEGWLDMQGEYSAPSSERYYFRSTIYRFMAFAALTNRFEREAIYVDARFAEPEDELIVFYVRALRWALTDPKLFAGLAYDHAEPTDHFFTDQLRRMCATLTRDDDELFDLHDVDQVLAGEHELQPVLKFFDDLKPGPPRWDRMMAYQLLLKAFINTIGYEMLKSEQQWFDAVAAEIQAPEVARNLRSWLPRFKLDKDPAGQMVLAACDRQLRTAPLPATADGSVPGDAADPQV